MFRTCLAGGQSAFFQGFKTKGMVEDRGPGVADPRKAIIDFAVPDEKVLSDFDLFPDITTERG